MLEKLPKTRIARAKAIEKTMKLTWASLETHLPYTHAKHRDGYKHHRDSVNEYIQMLIELNKLW